MLTRRDRGRHTPTSNGYLFGSYCIATAPEPNSSRPTNVKSTWDPDPDNPVIAPQNVENIDPNKVNADSQECAQQELAGG